MAKFHLTRKAVDDLSGIWNYSFDTGSEEQVDKYYSMLIDACATIARDPKGGRRYPEVAAELSGYEIGRHIIFYRVLSSSEVEIARILHVRMDIKSRVKE